MLIIFASFPGSTPHKTVAYELAITKIGGVDFVSKLFAAVGIRTGCCRTDMKYTIFAVPNIGVVERIDVDGTSLAVV